MSFRFMINVSWTLFPVSGSYYNPLVTFLILAAAVGFIVARGGLRWPELGSVRVGSCR